MFAIKVGVMPGRITEVVVEGGTVADVLAIAELDATGYEVRVNGNTVDTDAPITSDGTVLLVKRVKGNGNFKIGVMPGRITEYALEEGTSVRDALAMAELDSEGYEIRVNGNTADISTGLTGDGTLLLVKRVKGNGTYKVGVMPGRIAEYAIEDGTRIDDLLSMAELTREGYEVRVNGNVTESNHALVGDGTVILAKRIKGNK